MVLGEKSANSGVYEDGIYAMKLFCYKDLT